MNTTHQEQKSKPFRQHILAKLNYGLKHEEPVEHTSSEILQNVSLELLQENNYVNRRVKLNSFLKQLEEAKLIRRYHMVYQSPYHNNQLNAALIHLTEQFKLKFSRYFSKY